MQTKKRITITITITIQANNAHALTVSITEKKTMLILTKFLSLGDNQLTRHTKQVFRFHINSTYLGCKIM